MEIKDHITVIIAIIGGSWALYQFWLNSKARRAALRREQAVIANREMEAFLARPEVRAVLRMVDWDAGEIELVQADGSRRRLPYDRQTVCRALRSHGGGPLGEAIHEIGFTTDEQELRDTFDAFLTRLESVDSLIEHDVISRELFWSHFSYWLRRLAENRNLTDGRTFADPECHRALWDYIRGYEYTGVVNLFARYHLAKTASG